MILTKVSFLTKNNEPIEKTTISIDKALNLYLFYCQINIANMCSIVPYCCGLIAWKWSLHSSLYVRFWIFNFCKKSM